MLPSILAFKVKCQGQMSP